MLVKAAGTCQISDVFVHDTPDRSPTGHTHHSLTHTQLRLSDQHIKTPHRKTQNLVVMGDR